MVVFSDLDRSIIYSNKFISEYSDYENIEIYNNKEISYISKKTIEYIKDLQELGMFIPTTTRTKEQFLRIDFENKGINFKWSITSNGGHILNNGKELKIWQEEILKLKKKSQSIENMVKEFKKYINTLGISKFKIAEDLFFYIVVDYTKFDLEELKEYTSSLEKNGWTYFESGRKIYFLPIGITKENAINFLVKHIKLDDIYSIGDSTMDLGMLCFGQRSYALKHGDVVKYQNEKNFIITKHEGMKGTEEVLRDINLKYNLVDAK